ncbi:protein-glutamate methylesterase/protein-glutamine glutaminase [Kurthia huakuii]|uniref:protein-glutamate methylesterase/protein-glutamine glutaminase n=1 Tax=Kurthia huakuii TaxID=1421019 RepID=UPI0004968CAC|nr:chemotaxis response regulator protein-glutamate methylesterase [Kurthia huakuii]MBM7698311.1 two-component system chemotaxis response regulator CheB [Kurthia huakuii]
MVVTKKLLIVDDSAFMRKLIGDFFVDVPTIEVIGTARNGQDALEKIKVLKPDVVTLDVEMPKLNGLEALKLIMADCPTPVVMLSSTTKAGAEITVEAMANGAVDFIAKPSGTISLDLHKIKDELVHKVLQAASVSVAKLRKTTPATSFMLNSNSTSKKVISKPIVTPTRSIRTVSASSNNWNSHANKKLVLVGTSTGGPRALQEVITKIPKSITAPILIVQHMPAGFTKSLAARLDTLSEITVKEAENGDILQAGVAYIAPGGYHMKLQKVGMSVGVKLDNMEAPRGGHRPAVDVLYESASELLDYDKLAVIMTGMGSDGTKGLEILKKTGNVKAISESAHTCVVYGMPKAAFETGLIDDVEDVDDIAHTIMKYIP